MITERYLGVFGHVNLDWLEDRRGGRGQKVGPLYGGVGGNISLAAARFGVPVALASVVGKDFPTGYGQLLKKEGVDLTYLVHRGDIETSKCHIITHENGEQQKVMITEPGLEDMVVPATFVDGKEILHISTGYPVPCIQLARDAGERGCTVAFDPGADLVRHYGRDQLTGVLEHSDILFLNMEELSEAMDLLDLGNEGGLLELVRTAIITMGDEGSRLMEGDHEITIAAPDPPRFEDDTGAGDAYRAGFYAGVFRGLDLVTACQFGSVAASHCVAGKGGHAGLKSWDELKREVTEAGISFQIP